MKNHLLFFLCIITTSLCNAQTFYGMIIEGGSADYGAIISFNAATNKESVVWSFAGAPSDGADPYASLVYDSSNGLFYGMTEQGGANSLGAIISFNPATNKDSLLWSFAGAPSDGSYPEQSFVYDASNGLFYGMTGFGGSSGYGAIISFNPSTNTDSVVWNFGGSPLDGKGPSGDLVYDASNGLFYGMTEGGGTNLYHGYSGGTIISFNPATNKDSLLWSFGSGTDGALPLGNLVYDASHKLFYGMTNRGGSNDTANAGYGTIISFDPITNKESVLWSLAGATSDGGSPYGSLVYDTSNGLFYAMTSVGGSAGYGAIISFDPSTTKESQVWSFGSGTDGTSPLGSLVYDAGNKLLYGMTQWGGTDGTGHKDGTIISFEPTGNSENVLWDFGSGTDGQQPYYGNLVIYPPSAGAGIKQLTAESGQLTIYPNPTSGEFTVNLNDNQIGNTVEVYNIMGERVYQSVLSNLQNTISLNNEPDGLYFVYLKSGEGVEVGKVLVTK